MDHLKYKMTTTDQFLQIGLLLALFLTAHLSFAQQDTLYFNTDWQAVQKDSAAYYRPPIRKEGELFRFQDYYMSGQLQMTALSKDRTKEEWEGTVRWYNEDGSLFQEGNYRNNRLDGTFISFLGQQKLRAEYGNGYLVSGKRNTVSRGARVYVEKKGDSLKEVTYGNTLNGIRFVHYSAEGDPRYLSKYYDASGKLIGERTKGPDGNFRGVEVFYYYGPMRIKEILYMPYGRQLLTESYYANGQVRDAVTSEPVWGKTFFDKNGNETASITYTLNGENLKQDNGTEYYFYYGKSGEKTDKKSSGRTYRDGVITKEETWYENGKKKNETRYVEGIRELQISYDDTGKETARMQYKKYLPYEGTETGTDRQSTYHQGELVEEIQYYPKSDIPQTRKTKTLQTYFDKSGNKLGELQLKYENGYSRPFAGNQYVTNYKDGTVTAISTYKEGNLVKRESFRERKIGENSAKTFRTIVFYESDGYNKQKEVRFYSNGKKQSETTFEKYSEALGQFYDEDENLLGTYDFKKKDGTLYVFFVDSDAIESMEKRKEGVLLRSKKYTYGEERVYGEINPVLIQEFDSDCCATSYNEKGEKLAYVTFKEGKPWEGTVYDHNKRTLFTLKSGKRNGPYEKFNYDGTLLEEGTYANDKKQGVFNHYHYNQKVKEKARYVDDVRDGETIFYDKKGIPETTIVYAMGLPMDGTVVVSGYGNNVTKETYENGALIRSETKDDRGKRITTYAATDRTLGSTTVFQKGTEVKHLFYTTKNGELHGTVVSFDNDGKALAKAKVENNKLISGTIRLLPLYRDNKTLFVEVDRTEERQTVTVVDHENTVVFKAEEKIRPGSTLNYIVKLDFGLDYIRPDNLY